MKRPPRPLFNLLLLLTFFVVLTYRALLRRGFSPFDLDARRFRLSFTPPRPVFNATILRFAENDLGEAKLNKDTEELLNGKKTGYFQYRTFATWYRVYGRLPLSRTAKERHVTIQATINPYWVEFRRNLQIWNQSRRFQDDIMLDLVKLVKHPLDRHRQLPVSDNRYSSCAVVGNSGILLESNYGDLIDSHEFVIRLNNAKTDGYISRVGSKTSISFVNSNILHLCARKPGCFCHPYGGNVPIVMYVCQAVHFLDHAICNATHEPPLLITDPRFDTLCSRIVKYYSSKRFVEVTGKSLEDWNAVHDGPNFHYSSGMQAIMLALGTCDKVSVFGFGKSNSTKHHYHTNQKGELHLHDYEAEYELYRDIIERPRSVPFVSDKFEFPHMEIYH